MNRRTRQAIVVARTPGVRVAPPRKAKPNAYELRIGVRVDWDGLKRQLDAADKDIRRLADVIRKQARTYGRMAKRMGEVLAKHGITSVEYTRRLNSGDEVRISRWVDFADRPTPGDMTDGGGMLMEADVEVMADVPSEHVRFQYPIMREDVVRHVHIDTPWR